MNAIEKLAKYTNATLIQCRDRQHWLTERVNSMGGSETPDLYGVGYGSEVKVWADKINPPAKSDGTEAQKIKLAIEPVVISGYMEKFSGTVEAWPQYTIARHPERPYLHSTPDAIVWHDEYEGPGSFSIKGWSEFGASDWADGPPAYTVIQVQTELAVLNLKWAVIAVMFGTQRIERYFVERNDYFIADLYEACGKFWRYVTDRVEPPIDASKATAAALARLHPNDSGTAIRLPAEADAIILERAEAKEQIKAAERIEARTENQLKAWIGDHTFGVSPEGRIVSWKSQTRKEYTVAESTFRVMREPKGLPKGLPVIERDQLPAAEVPAIESEVCNV